MPENFKVNLTNLNDIEIYELLLQGRIPNFPSGFWVNRNQEEARDVAIKLLRHLIENKLKLDKKEIKTVVSKKFMTKHKLHTASKLFGRSAIKYIMSCYPQEYEPWQFKNDKVPQSYWKNQDNRVNALKYLFQVDLKWSIDDVKERLSWSVLEENGLITLRSYYPSLCKIYRATYQNNVQPWEIINSEVPAGTWKSKSNRRDAVKWLIGRVKLENEQINRKTFAKYGLSMLLGKYYSDNATRAIRDVLGGKL